MRNRPIYSMKKTSKDDAKLTIYAERDRYMVTTTYNRKVMVFVNTTDNQTISKVVHKKADVDNLANVVIQKRNLQTSTD